MEQNKISREELKFQIKEQKQELKRLKRVKKRKSKTRKVIKYILLALLIVVLAMAAAFAYDVQKNGGGLSGFLSTIVGQDEEKLQSLDKLYCLVMGQSLNLTDTIIVASYDPKTQEASMLSIPRDTFVGTNKNKATAFDKINALYQSSPEKTLAAVNKITGLEIKYYLVVNTKALRQLVDEIGGVNFDVPINMKYDDPTQDLHINLKAGYQLLDGDKAEQVVRFRHNNNGSTYPSSYGQEDLGRMQTQRNFIMAVAKQTLKVENIKKINSLLDIYKENVKTNLNIDLVKQYVPYAVQMNMENIKTETLPGEPKKCNGVWVYIHDTEETVEVVNKLFLNIASETDEVYEDTNTIKDSNKASSTKSSNTTNNLESTKNSNTTKSSSSTKSSNTTKNSNSKSTKK